MPATPKAARAPGSPLPRPRRADARRNIAAILDGAVGCLADDPEASMAEIAARAGVGRVTLYGHFKTRAELIEAVMARTTEQAHETLGAVDTSGDPRAALARLVGASWLIVDQFRFVLAAAQRELPAERIHGAHDDVLGRIQALIERGQRAGAFRNDLPISWLVSLSMNVMHGAANEVSAGRLTGAQAPSVIAATMLAALTPPGTPVPPAPR
jgi:AcrR family transcriptional regulator